MEKPIVRISVRNLVEFILRSGDLDSRSGGLPDAELMLAGTRVHRKIQGSRPAGYEAEVPLVCDTVFEDMTIRVEGRADGLYRENEAFVVEEIKGVLRDVDAMENAVPVHEAQAKCYAAMLYRTEKLPEAFLSYVTEDRLKLTAGASASAEAAASTSSGNATTADTEDT
ncbi:MAG: hypothetical protein Q4B73_01260, partial [Lachnospiraceae bacterium]|nr:hypothetical protein [Lachnospiraceae bacterium]